MFTVCSQSASDTELNALVEMQRKTYEPLGLHCRWDIFFLNLNSILMNEIIYEIQKPVKC